MSAIRYRYFINGQPSSGAELHGPYLEQAGKLLKYLQEMKNRQGLQQAKRVISLEDGTVITGISSIGFDELWIDVPWIQEVPPPDPELEPKEPPIADSPTIWVAQDFFSGSPAFMRRWSSSQGLYGEPVYLTPNTVSVVAYAGSFWGIEGWPEGSGRIYRVRISDGQITTVLPISDGNYYLKGHATVTPLGVLFVMLEYETNTVTAVLVSPAGDVIYSRQLFGMDSVNVQVMSLVNDGRRAYLCLTPEPDAEGEKTFAVIEIENGSLVSRAESNGESYMGYVGRRLIGGHVRLLGYDTLFVDYAEARAEFARFNDASGASEPIADSYLYPFSSDRRKDWATAVSKVGGATAVLASKDQVLAVNSETGGVINQWSLDGLFRVLRFDFETIGGGTINVIGGTPSINFCAASLPKSQLAVFHVYDVLTDFDGDPEQAHHLLLVDVAQGSLESYMVPGVIWGFVVQLGIDYKQNEEWEVLGGTNAAIMGYART